jgi:type II secretory pathway pseudopilin PulG
MVEQVPESVPATASLPPKAWKVLASNAGVALSQSEQEYAVYNQNSFLGTWPLTEEGYKYAVQTYEAHQQSPAHGVAYTATGYQDPERLGLPTDPVMKSKSYASPMSYVGSTRRIVAWASKLAKRSPAYAFLGWAAAVVAMLFMWSFLLVWYFIVFGLFGLLMIPWRLIRRSQRKNLHVQQTSLATQQAMLQQMAAQQQQIQRQQQGHFQPPPGQIVPPSAPPAIPPPT